jgi:solute carrier family 25 carnitine/acylcarnitine transporter 20/29
MAVDFWAGYISGAAGIVIGNPLDLLKTRLQAGDTNVHVASSASLRTTFESAGTLVRGATAPILGYGALNGLLYYTYNRSLGFLHEEYTQPSNLTKIWAAGALGGLASFIISAPTELIKCRAQVVQVSSASPTSTSSLTIAKDILHQHGIRGLYFGGAVTSIRDAVGYGFYFWSYELSKRFLNSDNESDSSQQAGMKILLAGGIAGVVTWASIFPLDVVKTRVQTQAFSAPPSFAANEESALLRKPFRRKGALEIARQAYANEGVAVFFRGLGICSVRAFIVNAVQWAVYEYMMRVIGGASPGQGVKADVEVGAP